MAGSAGAQTVFFPGVLRQQWWTDTNPNGVSSPSRVQVEQGLAGLPTTDTTDLTIFSIPQTSPNMENFVNRVSGFFIAPITTNYVFFYTSDDDGDFFLSTDSTSLNKRLVCQETTWGNINEWTINGGGAASIPNKRSDQFSPDGGTTVPFKNGIPLVAGQKYWMESVHHEGGGGDDVAVTFKYVGSPDPTNGDASSMTGSVIGYGYTIPASFTVKTQPTNVTANAGSSATFTYVVDNTLPDPLVYQWYRNGTLITNTSYQQYTFLTAAADNNAQFQCIVTLPTSYNNSLSATSVVAKLTVNTATIAYTNGVKIERFLGFTRSDIENGNTGPASSVRVSTQDGSASPLHYTGFENLPNDGINNYAERASGWFIPSTTGNYVFFVSADDDTDLFLSSDNTAANKKLIAQENVWSNSREWLDSQGGGVTNIDDPAVFMKRSTTWTNGAGTAPYASGIALTAGTPYYVEVDHHQGGGGENFGVLAQLVGTPDPTNGAPPIPSSQLSLVTSAATTISFTNQPKNTTAFESAIAIFTASATSDSEFAVLYQWQRNGTNIPGATTTSYSLTTILADNASKFDLVAATAEGGLSTTSSVVTLTVQQAVFEKGLALMEYWLNKGADLTVPEGGGFGSPDFVMAVPAFEAGVNNENGNTYVNRISGFFVPATSGAYDFIVSGDDHIDVFLSTDSNPNNKRLICQQPGWSNARNWPGDEGGGADSNQKHSATWTNSTGVAPSASGIQLTAGSKYYLEAWHQEGGGGDSVAVTAVKHGDPDPAAGTDSSITGDLLGFNAPNTATYVAFTNQPVSQSTVSGTTATFSAGGVSDGPILIGTTGLFNTSGDVAGVGAYVKFPNVLFQWYKNGTLIPGATTSIYTTPQLKPSDNNGQYYAAIRTLGIATWSNSVTAVLTVVADTNKPTAYAAYFDENGLPVLSVSFDKFMDLATISAQGNYSISGGNATIVGISINTNDARHVQLQLSQTPTGPVTVTLTGITDFSGNAPASTTVTANAAGLVNADIGDPTLNPPDPSWPGYMWSEGPGAYSVSTQGSDIWGTGDGFNFSYESKTNDFDVVVRQVSFTKVSNWSKGGLMVREDLTPGSRNWNIVNDPTTAGAPAIDGSGQGANLVECNTRPAAGAASVGWDTTRPAPTYPNAWVRLKRTGQTLTAFASSNAVDWTQQAYTDWTTNSAGPMPAALYVGICATAHNNNAVDATVLNYYYNASFANYNSSFIPTPPSNNPKLTASISGGNIVISWAPAGGTLQSSPSVGTGAVWTPAGTANPATIPISGTAKFFRVGP
jgi:PA14 domain